MHGKYSPIGLSDDHGNKDPPPIGASMINLGPRYHGSSTHDGSEVAHINLLTEASEIKRLYEVLVNT